MRMDGIKWLFFDVGSTLVDESLAYEHRFRDIAQAANTGFDHVYQTAMSFYHQNKKGDLETARILNVALTKWHTEDERLYADAESCLKELSTRYSIGIIANQLPGTRERLEQYGILPYVDLIVASAEEGVSKPDRRIFEIALRRSNCTPEQAVMIGDRIDNDILPAKAMGMRTVWIRQGFGRFWTITQDAERPDITVENLMELCRNFLNWKKVQGIFPWTF